MKNQMELTNDKKQKDAEMGWSSVKAKGLKQILLVDDEVRFRILYKNIFKAIGFKVFTAANSSDACVLLTDEDIDLIILDINIAQEDGSVLFRVMRAYRKNIRVIVSSVYPIDEQQKKIQDADGYFDKSDNKEVLAMMVCSFLEDS